MKVKLIILGLAVLAFSCESRQYFVAEVDNPEFKPNTAFQSMEDLTNPRFSHLIEKYQLDTIFHGETDEFRRILLLRDWIKTVIPINDHGDPYPGDGYAEGILDAALEGQGYHCGHFMTVQNGIMNAYGYVTRCLGAGPGVKGQDGPDGHHGINEIWLNQFNKWVLSDAKYNHHFEKNGVPLSALEVRDEFLKNRAADIVLAIGPDREIIDTDEEARWSKERFAQTYTWITWQENGNYFSAWPEYTGRVIMVEDDFYTENIWIREGESCWIYDHMEVIQLIKDRKLIEWTPNTIAAEVNIDGASATITLNSDTPNLKEYQIKRSPQGEWETVDEIYNLDLQEKKYELTFHAVNLVSVTGPEHKVVIDSK